MSFDALYPLLQVKMSQYYFLASYMLSGIRSLILSKLFILQYEQFLTLDFIYFIVLDHFMHHY